MSVKQIKLAAVQALLGTCTSHAISAEFTDSNDGRLYFSGVNESLLDGGITLHYEEYVIYDTRRLEIVDGNGDEIDIDRIRLPRPFTTVFYPEAPYKLSK